MSQSTPAAAAHEAGAEDAGSRRWTAGLIPAFVYPVQSVGFIPIGEPLRCAVALPPDSGEQAHELIELVDQAEQPFLLSPVHS